ncbi:MAG TPA: M20/M25/M40 family metallo-hydrolase [Kofleriaceae bacterium]
MKSLALVVLAACVPAAQEAKPPAWVSDTRPYVPRTGSVLADRYRDVAAKILAAAHADRGAYDKLEQLTDRIGHRLAGSPELERAIPLLVGMMQTDGLDAHSEKVMVPHWVRGPEDAALVTPIARPIVLIGLGGTVATPKAGITAPVVVVHDWKELDAKRDAIAGSIVLYNTPMPAYSDEKGAGYGETVGYRTAGPSRAAKYGAVATLVRSVTARALRLPHTGALDYDNKLPKIPAAAVTIEDADLIDRLAAAGPVSVHLHLESQQLPDAESANVIGELRGRDKPDEIVVIGGHIDSWDVGQGAHDDGAGIVTMMEAAALLKRLGLVPRRTIRVVGFTNEENGTRGAKAYAAEHQGELARTVLALESDSGGFAPRGFVVGEHDAEGAKRLHARFSDLVQLLDPIGATRVVDGGHAGADIDPMAPAGVPQIGLLVDGRTYFDIHHTEADTLDKVDPAQLADDVAAAAILAYIAADAPDRLDAP